MQSKSEKEKSMQIPGSLRSPAHPFEAVLPSGRDGNKAQYSPLLKARNPLLFDTLHHLKADSSHSSFLGTWSRPPPGPHRGLCTALVRALSAVGKVSLWNEVGSGHPPSKECHCGKAMDPDPETRDRRGQFIRHLSNTGTSKVPQLCLRPRVGSGSPQFLTPIIQCGKQTPLHRFPLSPNITPCPAPGQWIVYVLLPL